jgi:hypothetical protein
MRCLTRLLLFLVVCWLLLWGLASFAVPRAAEAILTYAVPRVEQAGIGVDSIEYEAIRVSPSLIEARIDWLSAVFDLAPTDEIRLSSTFKAQEVSASLANPLQLRGQLTIEDFEVSFHETDRPRDFPFDRLTNARLHIEEIPLLSPRTAAREIYDGLEELFVENSLVGNFEFDGEVVVRIRDLRLPARLYTERQGEYFRLRFSKSDVEALVEAADANLSADQIDIISLYPVRVPSMIETTRQARALSKRHFPGNRWLRDALRHVSWSFLLTREFGPEFAKEVTDAQETRGGNTPEERSMDYHNNAVGRRLAGSGTRFENLPSLVRSHPDIIRSPAEVGSRSELLR